MISIRNIAPVFMIASLAWLPNLWAQILPFQSYSVRDGLLSDVIVTLTQDSRGFIWIGTGEGISVFDGKSFRNLNYADGYRGSFVREIKEDRHHPGKMWIGSPDGGLTVYEHGTFRTIRLDSTDFGNSVFSIAQSPDGVVWCGTGTGLYRVDGERPRLVLADSIIPGILSIVHQGDSLIWMATFYNLIRYDRRDGAIVKTGLSLSSSVTPFSTELLLDNTGAVWVGTSEGKLRVFREGRFVGSAQACQGVITQLSQDRNGNILVGASSGLYYFNPSMFPSPPVRRLDARNGLSASEVYSVLIDREDNLWIGTMTKGLRKLSSENLHTYSVEQMPPTPNNSIGSCDYSGRLWLVTYAGIWEIWKSPDGERKLFKHVIPAISKGPMCLKTFDSTGLWVKYRDASLERFDIVRQKAGHSTLISRQRLEPGKDFTGRIPFFFILDRRGNIWSCFADTGVAYINPRRSPPQIRLISVKDGLPDAAIRALYEDRAGNIWFGGNHNGLARLDARELETGRLKKFTAADGLADNAIRSIIQDSEGKYWIGTRFHGLSIFDGSTFENYDTDNGLLSNTVWISQQDRKGQMWFGTPSGIMTLSDSRSRSFMWSNRSVISRQVISGGAVTADELWFATADELTFMNTAPDPFESVPPPVYITQLLVNSNPIGIDGEARLDYDHNHVTIDYVGISFKDEKGIRYQYRLQGADDAWHPLTSQSSITYGALKPGSYVFEVKAVSATGIFSVVPASVRFTIAPPVWARWWFLLSTGILGLSAVVLFYRVRMNQLLRLERLRTRIATDLHDDIGSTLSSISIFSEMAGRESSHLSPQSSQMLKRIGESSRSMMDAMDDIVWSINPKNDRLENLSLRICEFAGEVFEARGIRFKFEVPESSRDGAIPMEVRRNIFLIVKEAVNNIAKHSRCTRAMLKMETAGGRLVVVIGDDGVGMSGNATRETGGNGLRNMAARAGAIGASLTVESDGKGTTVRLEGKFT